MTRWNAFKTALEHLHDNVVPSTEAVDALGTRVNHLVKRTSDTNTIIIVLTVVIPCVCVLITGVILYQRHVKRQRIEEEKDKEDELDYGLDGLPTYSKGDKKRSRAKSSAVDLNNEKKAHSRGISLEINNPFILPAALRNSTDSFHSLSRSPVHGEDPYRPSHLMMSPYANSSISRFDDASMHSGYSGSTAGKRALLSHSQRPSRSNPRTPSVQGSPQTSSPPSISPLISEEEAAAPVVTYKPVQEPLPLVTRAPLVQIPAPNVLVPAAPLSPNVPTGRLVREGNDQKGAFVPVAKQLSISIPAPIEISSPASTYSPPTSPPASFPPRVESRRSLPPPPVPKRASARTPVTDSMPSIDAQIEASEVQPYDDDATYADVLGIVQSPSTASPHIFANMASPNAQDSGKQALYGLGVQGLGTHDPSSRLRPLPPNDPNENAEQRANRIRSFYREYFDETKNPRGRQAHAAQYYEDYDTEYLSEAPIYDPATGQFVFAGAPYAQPMSRRAMTPPPRAPPRFHGTPRTHSPNTRGGRAYSSASGSHPHFRGRASSRPAVPPSPLVNLPTPHMLKDTTGDWSMIDFAPPQSYKDRQAGVPTSPRSDSRPYSPGARAHTPLFSAFDDLAVMPSPHALRKSGTFTAIDFAPPNRFRTDAAGRSETGSVLSMRSGLSNAQQASIRAGAYRVSRIPKEFVGTRDDFAIALKPSWDQRG